MECLKFECPYFKQSDFWVSYGECTLDPYAPSRKRKIDTNITCILDRTIKDKEEDLKWYKDKQKKLILQRNEPYIQRVCDAVTEKYPDAGFRCIYDEEDDSYMFEHFDVNLDRNDTFLSVVGEGFVTLLNNGINNIGFGLSMSVFDGQ